MTLKYGMENNNKLKFWQWSTKSLQPKNTENQSDIIANQHKTFHQKLKHTQRPPLLKANTSCAVASSKLPYLNLLTDDALVSNHYAKILLFPSI